MDNPPRYMALNRGQEAFQLFYERLLRIKERSLVEETFLLDHQFHLTTIINTFNRHYCGGIGSEDPDNALEADMTPVFLNLTLPGAEKPSLHRLLAIYLDYYIKRTGDIYLVFDHPAYEVAAPSQLEREFAHPIFRLAIGEFSTKFYLPNVYQFDPRDYPELKLKFDPEESNFYYEPYTGGSVPPRLIRNTLSQSLEPGRGGGYPPLFANLYVTGGNANARLCIDEYGIFRLLGTSGLLSRPKKWSVSSRYIAHNRYIGVSVRQPEFPSIDTMTDDAGLKRILAFFFGLRNRVYLFENFRHLEYIEKISLPKATEDATYMRNNTDSFGQTLEMAGYNSKTMVKEAIAIDMEENETSRTYINQYHRLNNYMNSWDAGLYALQTLSHNVEQQKQFTPVNWKRKRWRLLRRLPDGMNHRDQFLSCK